ncbi:hypothetical protein DID80_08215 [Candidatus Marinamargulisbacteria bacterium SCGC AAA071-K20]|nr:hypothetical protein DID80_08215 [Candidatus Marinamargulisbacteria bacterium SCGC AAA071-K20]
MEPFKLREDEKADLKRFHKSVRDGSSRDKIKAILMMDSGYSYIEIAVVLILEEKTIRRWKERYQVRKNITGYIFIPKNAVGI